MKTNFKTLRHLTLLAAAVTIISCEKEEDTFSIGDAFIPVEEISEIAMIDRLSEEVDNMAENVYYTDEQDALAGKALGSAKGVGSLYFMSDCVSVTTVQTENSIEKTLDFGAGCETANGNILRGIIHMTYSADMAANSNIISIAFEDFYFNEVRVSGGRTIVRERSNASGNPQASVSITIEITWEDGSVTKRQGAKVREWIEGVANGDWTDNAYLITGEWSTEFANGNVHQGAVVTPLRRELACDFIVSGALRLQRNNHSGTLDFGDGSCDNEAVFTSGDGDTRTIILN